MKERLWARAAAAVVWLGWAFATGLAQGPVGPDSPAPGDEPAGEAAGAPLATAGAAASPADAEPLWPAPPPSPAAAPWQPPGAEPFDIDRSPQVPPSEPPAETVRPLAPDGWPTVKQPPPPAGEKPSFWQRLIGASRPAPPTAPPVPALLSDLERRAPEAVAVAEVGAAPAAPDPAAKEMAVREQMRRQALEIEALKHLDLAYQAMGRSEWEAALAEFALATNAMPMRPHTVETLQKAAAAQARCEFKLADSYDKQGVLAEARRHAQLSLELAPGNRDALRLTERLDARTAVARPAGPTPSAPTRPPPLRKDPDYLAKQRRIRNALDNGRQYLALREYEKATREFNSVLLEDEGNEDANANLRKIAETGYDRETWQYERLKADMIAQVRDTWTPPVKQEVVAPPKRPAQDGVLDAGKQKLLDKLNTIVIPQLEFRQANIVDVIKYLDHQAIVADKTSPAGEKGVNLVLNLKRPGAAGEAAPAPIPEGDAEMLPGDQRLAGDAAAAGIPMISMTLRNIVLLEAIKHITAITGLKYRIESNVVMITPADVVVGEVISKTYRVQPNLGDLVRASSAAVEAPLGEIGAELMATPRAGAGAGGDVKRFFTEAGVPFPDGTSIKYQPSLNLLLVANTAENLEKFEEVLKQLNVIPSQVEIEARFVEISQTDLEELGIEWLLTDDWELAQDASAGASVPLSARERIQINKNNVTKGLREFNAADGTTAMGGTLGSVLSISSILTNPELTMILHALEQRSGANLLSAPKVTTKSGANAEIKVVREIIYPTEWEVGGGATGQQVATAVVQTPSAFETRDTGVILNVTPVVGPDGYTIDLTMMPQVVELADWINYGSAIIDPTTLQPIILNNPQPIFHSRAIQTSISIWDGQTVVMGGLITENEATTEDKIPFLGDIPLLGFLFKTKTSKSIKRNLLIFVSANLVDPAGNRINQEPIKAVTLTTSAAGAAVAAP